MGDPRGRGGGGRQGGGGGRGRPPRGREARPRQGKTGGGGRPAGGCRRSRPPRRRARDSPRSGHDGGKGGRVRSPTSGAPLVERSDAGLSRTSSPFDAEPAPEDHPVVRQGSVPELPFGR